MTLEAELLNIEAKHLSPLWMKVYTKMSETECPKEKQELEALLQVITSAQAVIITFELGETK